MCGDKGIPWSEESYYARPCTFGYLWVAKAQMNSSHEVEGRRHGGVLQLRRLLPFSAFTRGRYEALVGLLCRGRRVYTSNGSCAGPRTVLKVTHHGSKTSSTPLFLNRFPPEIAVIQVGADNSHGHPTPQTLERLQKSGAKVFRNDEHGDVIVTIKDDEADVAVTMGD